MATYAITASFSSVSTDARARSSHSVEDATGKACANLRYICRQSATASAKEGAILARTGGITQVIPEDGAGRRAFLDKSRKAVEDRAGKHTEKTGVRLLDKAIVSLPSDADGGQMLEIADRIVEEFAGDSDALVVAAIHRDRPGNPHIHLWCVDGLETPEQARKRAAQKSATRRDGKKTRARRQDHLRLGELNSRAQARLRCAAIIDEVAARDGLRRPETRSLEEQGQARQPQAHEGPQAADKARRGHGKLTPRVKARTEANATAAMRQGHIGGGMIDPEAVPGRLRPYTDRTIAARNAARSAEMDRRPLDDAMDGDLAAGRAAWDLSPPVAPSRPSPAPARAVKPAPSAEKVEQAPKPAPGAAPEALAAAVEKTKARKRRRASKEPLEAAQGDTERAGDLGGRIPALDAARQRLPRGERRQTVLRYRQRAEIEAGRLHKAVPELGAWDAVKARAARGQVPRWSDIRDAVADRLRSARERSRRHRQRRGPEIGD